MEKENSKECVVECGVVGIRNMDNDSRRQKEIRSFKCGFGEGWRKLVGWTK